MRTIRTSKKRATFLAELERTGNVSEACAIAGIGRSAIYDWRDDELEFRAAWEKALERSGDLLEEEARRRAHHGVEEPVYQGGVKVGTIRRYSDTLLIFLLKGAKPAKYGDSMKLKGDKENPVAVTIDGDALIDRIIGNRKDAGEPAS